MKELSIIKVLAIDGSTNSTGIAVFDNTKLIHYECITASGKTLDRILKISNKIVTYDDNSNDVPYEVIGGLQGRKTYIINNLRSKHIYLSIKSAQDEIDCNSGKITDKYNNTCSKDLSYLLYYYSTMSHRLFSDNNIYTMNYRLDSRARFYLILPHINTIDSQFLEYNLIWTKNETYAKNLESICYLSQMFNKESEIDNSTLFIEKNIELNTRNEILVRKMYLSSQPTYINILVRNKKNNQLIAFQPLIVVVNTSFLKILFYIIMIAALFFGYYYCYDPIKNKLMDIFVNGFNFGNLFGKKSETVKYTNLSDYYY